MKFERRKIFMNYVSWYVWSKRCLVVIGFFHDISFLFSVSNKDTKLEDEMQVWGVNLCWFPFSERTIMEFFETINKHTAAYKKERVLTPKSSMQCKTKYYICRTKKRRSLNPRVALRRY